MVDDVAFAVHAPHAVGVKAAQASAGPPDPDRYSGSPEAEARGGEKGIKIDRHIVAGAPQGGDGDRGCAPMLGDAVG